MNILKKEINVFIIVISLFSSVSKEKKSEVGRKKRKKRNFLVIHILKECKMHFPLNSTQDF